jgi:hypothetical protein
MRERGGSCRGASEAAVDGGSAGVLTKRALARWCREFCWRKARPPDRVGRFKKQAASSSVPCCQAAAIAWLPAPIEDPRDRLEDIQAPPDPGRPRVRGGRPRPNPSPPEPHASARGPAGSTPRSSRAPRFRPTRGPVHRRRIRRHLHRPPGRPGRARPLRQHPGQAVTAGHATVFAAAMQLQVLGRGLSQRPTSRD